MRKNWLRMLSVMMCFLMVFGLMTGCGGTATDEGTAEKQVVIATDVELKSLDPMGNWSGACYFIYWTCYDRLLNYDYETGEFQPGLATSWEMSEDGMEYIFHLRDDVKWHDGTQFTAKDVVYTVARGIETSNGNYPKVDHAEAIDDYTVKFVMQEPNSLVMDKQWIGDSAVIKDGSGDTIATEIMGTGPFKVKEWRIGEHLIIEANPDYWGEKAQVQEIKFVCYPEASARLMAVQAGDLDITSIAAANVKAAMEDENIYVVSAPGTYLRYVALNQGNEYLSNKLVRQAINHAINKEDVLTAAIEGMGVTADAIVPTTVGGHNPDIEGYEYDIEKAKALLAEAGYPDGFEIELTYASPAYDLYAQIIQANLKEAGITVKLDGKESAASSEKINAGQHEMALSGRGASDANYYVNVMHSSHLTDGRNQLNMNDPEIDALLNKIFVTEGEERDAVYKEAQVVAHEEAVIVPLVVANNYYAANKDIEGLGVIPTGGNDFRFIKWAE